MKSLPLAFAVLLGAACRRSAPPEEPIAPARADDAGVSLVDYDAATGEFSCRAPGDWRTLEDKSRGPRVMFFGPGGAQSALPVAISVSRYPDGSRIRTPQAYWNALKLSDQNPSPLQARAVGGRTAYAFHYELARRPLRGRKVMSMKREDVVLIPVQDGFFALAHSAPAEDYARTLPVFEDVVASFRPKR